jgi:hypothetical protein
MAVVVVVTVLAVVVVVVVVVRTGPPISRHSTAGLAVVAAAVAAGAQLDQVVAGRQPDLLAERAVPVAPVRDEVAGAGAGAT